MGQGSETHLHDCDDHIQTCRELNEEDAVDTSVVVVVVAARKIEGARGDTHRFVVRCLQFGDRGLHCRGCPRKRGACLDATEHEDHVVFMHNIQEGPANRSFGLQVAKLAGVPSDVLSLAHDKLIQLETTDQGQPPRSIASPSQTDLFQTQAKHPAIEQLKNVDPDALTPREALALLYALKSQI